MEKCIIIIQVPNVAQAFPLNVSMTERMYLQQSLCSANYSNTVWSICHCASNAETMVRFLGDYLRTGVWRL